MKFSGIARVLTTVFGLAAIPPAYHYASGNLTPPPLPADGYHDSIVVFTGGAERVVTGYELYLAGSGNRLMVSGYDYRHKLAGNVLDGLSKETDTKRVYIDDLARSTIENASNTAEWVLDNNIKNLLLVTSASHMQRAYFELRRLLPADVKVFAHPLPDKASSKFLDNETNRLLCRIYETFLNGSFCYQARAMAREWAL